MLRRKLAVAKITIWKKEENLYLYGNKASKLNKKKPDISTLVRLWCCFISNLYSLLAYLERNTRCIDSISLILFCIVITQVHLLCLYFTACCIIRSKKARLNSLSQKFVLYIWQLLSHCLLYSEFYHWLLLLLPLESHLLGKKRDLCTKSIAKYSSV